MQLVQMFFDFAREEWSHSHILNRWIQSGGCQPACHVFCLHCNRRQDCCKGLDDWWQQAFVSSLLAFLVTLSRMSPTMSRVGAFTSTRTVTWWKDGIQNEKGKREEKKQKNENVSALPNEKEVAILREGPGGYFGEMALIYNRPRNATIQARSWLRIHQLFRRDYLNTFQLYPNEKKKMDEVVGRMKLFQSLKVVKVPPGKRASKGGEFSFEQSVSETMVNRSHQ